VQDHAARVAAALELLRVERYGEALELLDGLGPIAARDVDVMLLRAVLLTHTGRIATAEQACNSLLALDGLNAGAHYLLALCAERSGALARAVEHDEAAAYLDPSFAMARLHLGLMARRRREQHTARRELARALALLEREDPARLLLFGGGFGRETLVALCCAELAACGGAP
jgi:chemotaxis protein methyltransferase CheR